MGAIFDAVFEVIFEVVVEALFDAYIWLMTLILPEHKVSRKTEQRIRALVIFVSLALLVLLVIGLIMLIGENNRSKGLPLTVISGAIIAFQIVFGICVKIFKKLHKR